MNQTTSRFLQGLIVIFGLGLMAALLYAPTQEGVNVNATLFEIYFQDPFLAYTYLGSIPFFVALYQTFKVLGYAGQNNASSPEALKALKTIKYCALTTAAAIVGADIYIMVMTRSTGEDGAGAIMLGIIATFICLVIAGVASMFKRVLKAT